MQDDKKEKQIMNIAWIYKKFDELTPHEVYAFLRLRSEVFVVEQNCAFLDADNKDQACYHLMGFTNNVLVAYTRIVPAGVTFTQASIGRVVTSPRIRRDGVGKQLMNQRIDETNNLFGKRSIKIGAQLYLKSFYESLGFVQSGEIYDEDGIDHIHMIRP